MAAFDDGLEVAGTEGIMAFDDGPVDKGTGTLEVAGTEGIMAFDDGPVDKGTDG